MNHTFNLHFGINVSNINYSKLVVIKEREVNFHFFQHRLNLVLKVFMYFYKTNFHK